MSEATYIGPLSKRSFRSHIIRALLDWCDEEGYTPYILIDVDDACLVPREYVNPNNTIVLCVSALATHNFNLDKDKMSFQTRFGERVCSIEIPLGRIAAFYPKENTDLMSYFSLLPSEEQKSDKKTEEDIPVFTKL